MMRIRHENKQNVWVKSSSPDLSDKKHETHGSDLLHVFLLHIYKHIIYLFELMIV